ncbi:MAG: hypothetical protein GY941_29975 [Planctomycetes bacterium]|nr:hypothetical protein [Planctomycetota bacterium]
MHNERRALSLLSAGLKQLELTSKTLKSLPKGAPEKKRLYGIFEAKQRLVMTGYQNTYSAVIQTIYYVVLMKLKARRILSLID